MKNILVISVFICCLNFSFAQSTGLDPSFGTKGIVKTDMGSSFVTNNSASQVLTQAGGSIYIIFYGDNIGTSISKRLPNASIDSSYGFDGYSMSVPFKNVHAAFQPDGKIVIAGSDGGLAPFGISRMNNRGMPDSTFGNNGIQTIEFNPRSVTLQSDGKIVVAGGDDRGGFEVARFNASGSPDNSFNGNGHALTYFVYKMPPTGPGEDSTEVSVGTANTIAIQADGKIVVGGTAYSEENGNIFAIARYNIDGNLDSSFGVDGKQTTLIGPSNASGYSLALQSDGKIVLVGYTSDGESGFNFAVARYDINGVLDNSFNGNGMQIANLVSDQQIGNSTAIQSNGKIIVAGYTLNGDYNDFGIAQFNVDGSPDNSFDNDGILTTDINASDDYAGSVAIQSDGKIIVAGYAYINDFLNFVITRYDANGALDNTFDNDGKLEGDYKQGNTYFNSTAVQTDGKVVAAGRTWNGTDYDFAVARYNSNGSPDNTFSDDGKLTSDFGPTDDEANAVVIQPDGKIVVAGNSDTKFAIARFNTNGSFDNTFSGNGKQLIPMGFADDCKSVALQPDGKIVLAGSTFIDPNYDSAYFAIARIKANGTPDNSFSLDGKQFTDFDGSPGFGSSVAVQTNGRIVVAGRSYLNGQDNFALIRYNTDGGLDTTFSHDGKQNSFFGQDNYFGRSLALGNDGKIVVAGFSEAIDGSSSSFAVARYKSNGDLDNTFNNNGFQSINLGNHFNFGASVAINTDGRIAVGGTNDNFAIVIYKKDGSQDSTFGTNGVLINNIGVGSSSIQSLAFANNLLYAAGAGQFPGTLGVVARYLCSEGGPLPVTLVDFQAISQNDMVLLQWQTASEQNLSGFNIQRSDDGNDFSSIGHVAATGNSSAKINYSTTDRQPLPGINFYRLKLVDKDGKFNFSKIVTVNINHEIFSLKISPNPAKNVLFVSTPGENERGTFQIIDAAGRILKEIKVSLNGNTPYSIHIDDLPGGIYILQLHTKTITESRRFIKQ